MQDVTENRSELKRKCKLFFLQQNEKQMTRIDFFFLRVTMKGKKILSV